MRVYIDYLDVKSPNQNVTTPWSLELKGGGGAIA